MLSTFRLNLLFHILVYLGDCRILQNLLCCRFKCLFPLRLIFKQKGKLLQSLTKRLREEEVYEHDFEAEPADVDQEIFPADIFQANRVDETA